MKNLLTSICLIFLISIGAKAQEMSCCSMSTDNSATARFASLGSDDGFSRSHLNPLPYVHYSEKGKMITMKASDGKDAKAYFIKSTRNSEKYLFVFHEWWGLNGHIQKEADKYAEIFPDVNILAIDLYDGKVADKREDAASYMQSLSDARARAIVNAALSFAGKNAKIATIGWCMGGGWSMQASLMAGKQNIGCVIYYGMPEKDVDKLKTLQGDVLGIFAGKEQWINKDVVADFEANMKKAGKSLQVEMYDAEHAFANPSNPIFDKSAAEDAHNKTVTFLKARF